jgi:hypothetical protein
VPTVRWRLFRTAEKIVRHGWRMLGKIGAAKLDMFAAIGEHRAGHHAGRRSHFRNGAIPGAVFSRSRRCNATRPAAEPCAKCRKPPAPDTAAVIARFAAFLALLGNGKWAGNSFSAHHTASSNIPVRLLGSAPIFPRNEVFPKTFVRRRRFQPKIGETAKKWLKLTGESEIDGVLEPVPRFFQASPIRPGLAARPDPIGSPLR